MQMTKDGELVIIASTFPRWEGDSVPPFVLHHAKEMQNYFSKVKVLAPHYKNSKKREILEGVNVKRFRYFYPAKMENIVYEGGGANKISKNPLYLLKLTGFLFAEFFMLFIASIRTRKLIINAHWLIPQGVIAVFVGKLTRTPVVITIHGSDVFSLNKGVIRKLKRYALKNAQSIVVNSGATQDACRSIYDDREYPIVPMGVDTDQFKTPKVTNGKKKFTIVTTGRLSPEKGVLVILKAVGGLMKNHANIELIIIGEGPDRKILENYIKNEKLSNYIKLVGWKKHEEIVDIYKNADVFVGASLESERGLQEAFGLVFAEASAAGLPVVATDTGGIKDVVKNNVTGFLVNQNDPEAIQAKLEYIYNNPKISQQLGQAGTKFVSDNFSWKVIAKKYITIFQNLP